MGKGKGKRINIILEHATAFGKYRYHTLKNRQNTIDRLKLKKYSPLTKKHEIFKELK